mgnify:CR=1 FL=1
MCIRDSFGVPMVIFYRVWKWGYRLIGRWLIRTPYLSLVNILAGEQLVPELMPWYGDAGEIARQVEVMLEDVNHLRFLQGRLQELVKPLRAPAGTTAAENTADLIIDILRRGR